MFLQSDVNVTKENQEQQMRISCVRGTRQTHLGVNPYSTDGTDLKIVTWQATEKKDKQRESERGGEGRKSMCERCRQKKKKKTGAALINIPHFTRCY